MQPTPELQAQLAVDDLLAVITKAAEDLHAFRTAVAGAPASSLPPFPKATVIVAVDVIDHLKAVEQGLRDILTGLGLAESPTAP